MRYASLFIVLTVIAAFIGCAQQEKEVAVTEDVSPAEVYITKVIE